MKSWFVVHTQTKKEIIAQMHLEKQGFEVYLPCFKKIIRHARKTKEICSPLFSRYLFIAIDLKLSCWRSVNGTRGVVYLLTNNDQPSLISNQAILDLKSQEDADGLLSIDSLNLFAKGDKIRVLDGAFKDHTAVFEMLDDQQRVQLLLSFLGRELRVSVPLHTVEAA